MHVIVHIGPFKTGSTSIQASMDQGSDALLEQGCYYYPGEKPGRVQSLSTLYARGEKALTAGLSRAFPSIDDARAWSEQCWQNFEADIRARKPALTVISSEHLSNIRDIPVFIDRLRETFDRITVVGYLREPLDLYCSSLQQKIRAAGKTLSEINALKAYHYRARRHFRLFMEAVGPENMVVRKYSRTNLKDGDAVQDFLSVVSSFGTPVSVPTVRANESVPGAAVAWLLTLNETGLKADTPQRRAIIKRFEESEAVQALPKLKLTDPALIAIINRNTHKECAWLNKTFLNGQEPLKAGLPLDEPEGLNIPESDEEVSALMRQWLLGYLTPEATQAVADAAMAHEKKTTGKELEDQ